MRSNNLKFPNHMLFIIVVAFPENSFKGNTCLGRVVFKNKAKNNVGNLQKAAGNNVDDIVFQTKELKKHN